MRPSGAPLPLAAAAPSPKTAAVVSSGILLHLLLLGGAGLFPPAHAQQAPPLQGQGTSPCLAGYPDYCKLPVYTSADLLRLQSVDDRSYELRAVVYIEQSWVDPRADAIFDIINARDMLLQAKDRPDLYKAAEDCVKKASATASPSATSSAAAPASGLLGPQRLNLSVPECQDGLPAPPPCGKYCTTNGQDTDNPYRCCDLVWLPDVYLSNLLEITQDRIVYDSIDLLEDPKTGDTFVHRSTRVQGLFYSPLALQDYPFDQQKLNIIFDVRVDASDPGIGFGIVPSSTSRHLNPDLSQSAQGAITVKGVLRDELAGWSIDNVTFSCAKLVDIFNADGTPSSNASKGRLQELMQNSDPDDPYFGLFYSPTENYDLLRQLFATCALTVHISRLSPTLVAQSILPVAFVGCLAFVPFFAGPDLLDLRLGTEISLFLALTAVQFIFASVLPLTSYLTAFDIFILLTYSTIVMIVVENIVVYYVATREESQWRKWKGAFGARDGGGSSGGSGAYLGHLGSRRQGTEVSTGESGAEVEETLRIVTHKGGQEEEQRQQQQLLQQEQEQEQEEEQEGQHATTDGSKHQDQGVEVGNSSAQGYSGRDRHKQLKFGAFRKFGEVFQVAHSRIAQDSALAYRVARKIDVVLGTLLFVVYVILGVLNFTVGFHSG